MTASTFAAGLLTPSLPSLRNTADGIHERDSECVRDLPQSQQGQVVFGPFHATDVGSMQTTFIRQIFLRPTQIFAGFSQEITEMSQHGVFRCHAVMLSCCSVFIDRV